MHPVRRVALRPALARLSTAERLLQASVGRSSALCSSVRPRLSTRAPAQLSRLTVSASARSRGAPLSTNTDAPYKMDVPVLSLDPIEDALCTLLDQACQWITENKPQPDPVESCGVVIDYHEDWTCDARIAGGWVRDKLLGHASHDLDVSLSTLTGHIFALLLRSYLLSEAFRSTQLATDPSSPLYGGTSSSLVGHISKIAANPEQSKNLETATAKVAGLQLDFVNLRKEVYEGNSRIPKMTFGTPLEDAQRRDITINSLFFNVHTRQVEDCTGMGLVDLREKIIRTPLSPRRTFLDDPLRVLRCVRFASRFQYAVNYDIVACLNSNKDGDSDEIRKALTEKVSRERFGIEVDKMLRGPDPLLALDLIKNLDLFPIIFQPAPNSGEIRSKSSSITAFGNVSTALEPATILDQLWVEARRRNGEADAQLSRAQRYADGISTKDLERIPSTLLHPLLDGYQRRNLFLSAALRPLQEWEWEEKKGKWFTAAENVVAIGLKLGGFNTRDPVAKLFKSVELLSRPSKASFDAGCDEALANGQAQAYRGHFIPNLAGQSVSPRATLALIFRLPTMTFSKKECELSPETFILWNLVLDICDQQDTTALDHILGDLYTPVAPLIPHLQDKALLDGNEVSKALGYAPGPLMQRILTMVEAWQFDHLDDLLKGRKNAAELKEECKAWLREEWDSGGIISVEERMASKKEKKQKKQKKSE